MMRNMALMGALLAAATAAPVANASDFSANISFGPGSSQPGTVTAYRDHAPAGLYSPYAGRILAGRFSFHVTSGAADPAFAASALTKDFNAYCVDISNVDMSPTTFKSATFIDATATGATLYKKATSNDPSLVAADGKLDIYGRLEEALWIFGTYGNKSTISGDQAAGIQLAMWNVMEDTDFTVTSGASARGPEGNYFSASQFSSAAMTDADAYLGGLQSALSKGGGKSSGYYLHTDAGQDVLALGPGQIGTTAVTPEGSSLALLGAGTLPLWLFLRRTRAKRV